MKNLHLFLLLFIAVISCDTPDDGAPEEDVVHIEMQPRTDYPRKEVEFGGQVLMVAEVDGLYIYQDDIIIPERYVRPQIYTKKTLPIQNSVGRASGFWENNTVFYAINSNLPDKHRVYDAIAHWEENTNIKFVERTTQYNYVYFTTGSGCSSYVGQVGGRQSISLSSYCSTGNTIHEIGHAIGLWHEHSRADRDQYVIINYENITSGREHNFNTYAQQGFDGDEYTNTLDYGSIMMYGSYSFSKNNNPTIVKLDGSTFNVQRSGLSEDDIIGINKMYPTTNQPSYENKKFYTLYGLTVLRFDDKWFYYESDHGWAEVALDNGVWYYVYE